MVKLFLSYSHQDEDLRNELEKHLAVLRRSGVIDVWHDRRIGPGGVIDHEISVQLEAAEVVLLLVSPDFLHSDYCYDIEMTRAMERHTEGTALVIPIILRPCDWHQTPIGKLNAAPTDGKPVTEHSSLDAGFLDVARAVRIAVETHYPAAPSPGHVIPPAVHSSFRSGNLRIKKQFSDRDRDKFLNDGFEGIAKYFENSLKELEARNPELDTTFKRIDTNHFEVVAYIDGTERSRCGIWLGGGLSRNGLSFSYTGIGNDNSCNESMSIGNDGYMLSFEPMGMAHFEQGMSKNLTHVGAAEYFWSLFIDKLR